MKKVHRGFIKFYFIWGILNVLLMIMASSGVFGASDRTLTEFWPFTVGSPRYYDLYELIVYLGMPLLIYIVYRAGQSRKFWIPYIIWSILNIAIMIMAVLDVFGTSNRTVKKFWPFSVGELLYYDLLELVVYLTIPLIVYYVYLQVQHHQKYSIDE
ncbi:MAG: hypothetical protein WCM76_04545 [Bacteroidota bacterium]